MREGLIRARLFGANLASGQVIKTIYSQTYLDRFIIRPKVTT